MDVFTIPFLGRLKVKQNMLKTNLDYTVISYLEGVAA